MGIWAENQSALAVLLAMHTQLRRSGQFGRVVGLDYTVLPWVMQRCRVPDADLDDVFARVQWAESELIACCNES